MKNKIGRFVNGVLEVRVLEDYTKREKSESGEEKITIITAESQLAGMIEQGWKPMEEIDGTQLECDEEFFSTLVEPIEKENSIGFRYTKRLDKRLVESAIEKSKEILAGSDYRIAKCYEASLLKSSLPYNIDALHDERQAIRDRINELKRLIN